MNESTTTWLPLPSARGAGHVGADVIAGDDVVICPGTGHPDAGKEVAAQDVSLERVVHAVAVGADQVGRGAAVDLDAGVVGEGDAAGRVGADVVAGDHVAGRARAGDLDAVAGVARDDVAGACGRAADRVARRAAVDLDARAGVGRRDRSARVGADQVSLDDVGVATEVGGVGDDRNSEIAVAGNHIVECRIS